MKLNVSNYRKLIGESKKPFLVEFFAPWCVDCHRMESAMEQLTAEYQDVLQMETINIDEEPELAKEERIEHIPTFFLYNNGRKLGTIVEPQSRAEVDNLIREKLQISSFGANEDQHIYDMVVVGGGPGGYTAALYAARAGLDTVVLEKLSAGGQLALTHQIDNYPGFEEGIDGFTLADKMRKGAERFGVKSMMTEVISLQLNETVKRIVTNDGSIYGRTVVLATGANPKELGVDGEKRLTGQGVSYCASCDGMFYRNRTVFVVGGGNSAVEDAMILSRICKKVILVHRRDTLRATKIYHEPLMKAENIEFHWNSTVVEVLGEERVTGIRLKNLKTDEESVENCDGVFISVGRKPSSELVKDQLELDAAGYIVADESTRTSISGVFAVGDVRTKAVRQVVTAVADGATAVHYAEEYLNLFNVR